MKKKILSILFLSLLCSACAAPGMEATIEDAQEIAIDNSGTKEEVQNLEAKKTKEGYIVEFDTEKGHYKYKITKEGLVKDKNFTVEKKEKKEEKKEPEKSVTPQFTEEQKKAKTNSLLNAGVTEANVENLSVKNDANGNIIVTFTIKGGNTVVTTADKAGNLISSEFR